MSVNGNLKDSPIVYPTLEIRGKAYQLKLGMNASYRQEHYGMANLGAAVEKLHGQGRNLQLTFKLAACLLGTETSRGLWKPINFPDVDLDELPEVLAAELMDRFQEVSDKVLEALRKAAPAETAQPPAAVIGPTIQVPSESEKIVG